MRSWVLVVVALLSSPVWGQAICKDGKCSVDQGVLINPLQETVFIDSSSLEAAAFPDPEDRLNHIVRAIVRVTVNGVCGSGTIVGRDQSGNAIVLTNAHVAGTQKGRTVLLERWDLDGKSERGQGVVIASGYGRGISIDFALLKCNSEFARNVTPIPLADRYPSTDGGVTTYGCPRCEWPSMQVLKLNRAEGQILTWKPEAIGGRSGSSLIDNTEEGPRVVGLLTWGGGGEGLGQSTPFLLSAMRGKLPATLEGLPDGVREVSFQEDELGGLVQVPSTTLGEPLISPLSLLAQTTVQDDTLDSIVERPRLRPAPQHPEDLEPTPGLLRPNPSWSNSGIVATSAASSVLLILGLQYGLPLVLQAIRNARKSQGKTVLNDQQFQQLIDQYQQIVKLMEQNGKSPPNIKT